jgi:hypothetical protein
MFSASAGHRSLALAVGMTSASGYRGTKASVIGNPAPPSAFSARANASKDVSAPGRSFRERNAWLLSCPHRHFRPVHPSSSTISAPRCCHRGLAIGINAMGMLLPLSQHAHFTSREARFKGNALRRAQRALPCPPSTQSDPSLFSTADCDRL